MSQDCMFRLKGIKCRGILAWKCSRAPSSPTATFWPSLCIWCEACIPGWDLELDEINFHLFGRGKLSVLLDVNCHTCSCFVHVCAVSFDLRNGLHMSSFKICICLCLSLTVFRWHCVVGKVLKFNYRPYALTIVSVLVIIAMWTLCVYIRERLWVWMCMREGESVCMREREREIVVRVCACTSTRSLLESL